jgi:translocation and assembly module TamB
MTAQFREPGNEQPAEGGQKKTGFRRWLRTLLRITLALFLLIVFLLILLNIPGFQTYLAQKFIQRLREKTGAEMHIGSVRIALPGSVTLQDFLAGDGQGDTILYVHSLQADISIAGLLRKKLAVTRFSMEHSVSHILRKGADSTFNYQFLVDYFSSPQPDTPRSPSAPWTLEFGQLTLRNLHVVFLDEPVGNSVSAVIGECRADCREFRPEDRVVNIQSLHLSNASLFAGSHGGLPDKPPADSVVAATAKTVRQPVASPDLLSGWTLSVNDLRFSEIALRYADAAAPALPRGTDYQHLFVKNLNAGLHSIAIRPGSATAVVDSLRLQEKGGLTIRKMAGEWVLSDRKASVNGFVLEANSSRIRCDAAVTYPSPEDFLRRCGSCTVSLDLRDTQVDANDVVVVLPSLESDPRFAGFKNSQWTLTARAEGTTDDLVIGTLDLAGLNNSRIRMHGRVKGLPVAEQLQADLVLDELYTVAGDIRMITGLKDVSYRFPSALSAKGHLSGGLDAAQADLFLSPDQGAVEVHAAYSNRQPGDDSLHVDFQTDHLAAGTLLRGTLLGSLSMNGTAHVARRKGEIVSGWIRANVGGLELNGYRYRDVHLAAQLDNGTFSGSLRSGDPHADVSLQATADLRSPRKQFSLMLDARSVSLDALHFSQQPLRVTTRLESSLDYTAPGDAEGHLRLDSTVLVTDGKRLPVDTLVLTARSAPEGTELQVTSALADGYLRSNVPADSIPGMLQSAFRKYFTRDTPELKPGRVLEFSMNFHLPDTLLQLANEQVKHLEVSRLEGRYRSDDNSLSAGLQVSTCTYGPFVLDSISLDVNGRENTLQAELLLRQIAAGPVRTQHFRVNGETADGRIRTDISIRNDSGALTYHLANELAAEGDSLTLKFLPGGMLLDGRTWTADPDNLLRYTRPADPEETAHWDFLHFEFSSGDEAFGIRRQEQPRTAYTMEFNNFALENLSGLVEWKPSDTATVPAGRILRGNMDCALVLPASAGRKDLDPQQPGGAYPHGT